MRSPLLSRLALSLYILSALLISTRTTEAEVVDRIVALVNESVITLSELEELTIQLEMSLQSVTDPVQRAQLLREQTALALDQLIGQRLLLEMAREQGISISDEQAEQHLNQLMRQQGWGEAELEKYLRVQGMTREALKQQSKDFLLQQTVAQRNLASKLSVSEVELRDAYETLATEARGEVQVFGAHILLKVQPGVTSAQEVAIKQRAQELLNRAQAGEDFTKLVQQFSESSNAALGGDLGLITRGGGLPTELEDAFLQLKTGELGGPVRSPFGYHVLYVREVKSKPIPPFDEARPMLEAQLRQEKYQRALKSWIEEMKANAFIERRL